MERPSWTCHSIGIRRGHIKYISKTSFLLSFSCILPYPLIWIFHVPSSFCWRISDKKTKVRVALDINNRPPPWENPEYIHLLFLLWITFISYVQSSAPWINEIILLIIKIQNKLLENKISGIRTKKEREITKLYTCNKCPYFTLCRSTSFL